MPTILKQYKILLGKYKKIPETVQAAMVGGFLVIVATVIGAIITSGNNDANEVSPVFVLANPLVHPDSGIVVVAENKAADVSGDLDIEFEGLEFSRAGKLNPDLKVKQWHFSFAEVPKEYLTNGRHRVRVGLPGQPLSEPLFFDINSNSPHSDTDRLTLPDVQPGQTIVFDPCLIPESIRLGIDCDTPNPPRETMVFDPCLLPEGLRKPGTDCDTPDSTQIPSSTPPIITTVAMPAQLEVCGEDGSLLFLTPLLTAFETQLSDGSQRFLIDVEAFEEGIWLKMRRKGITQEELCNDLREKKNKLENDPNYDYWRLLDDLMACESSCGQVLASFGNLYIATSAKHFKDLVRFNFGRGELLGRFQGDRTHGGMMIDNVSQLETVYQAWDLSGQKQTIGLDARASIPGSLDLNEQLSQQRVSAVANWFASKGVPPDKIDRKWLGEYGPHIDEDVAALYGFSALYDAYEAKRAKKSTFVFDGEVRWIFDGLNDSVAMFLYD